MCVYGGQASCWSLQTDLVLQLADVCVCAAVTQLSLSLLIHLSSLTVSMDRLGLHSRLQHCSRTPSLPALTPR